MYRMELKIEGTEYKSLEKFLAKCFEAKFMLIALEAKAQKVYLVTDNEFEAKTLFNALAARLLEFNCQSQIIGDAPIVALHKNYLITDIDARINSIALASLATELQTINAAQQTVYNTPYSARPPQKYKYEDLDVVEARKASEAEAAERAARAQRLANLNTDESKEQWKAQFTDEDNERFKEALSMVGRLCRTKWRRPGTVEEIETEWKASKLMMMLGEPRSFPLERLAEYVARNWNYKRGN